MASIVLVDVLSNEAAGTCGSIDGFSFSTFFVSFTVSIFSVSLNSLVETNFSSNSF